MQCEAYCRFDTQSSAQCIQKRLSCSSIRLIKNKLEEDEEYKSSSGQLQELIIPGRQASSSRAKNTERKLSVGRVVGGSAKAPAEGSDAGSVMDSEENVGQEKDGRLADLLEEVKQLRNQLAKTDAQVGRHQSMLKQLKVQSVAGSHLEPNQATNKNDEGKGCPVTTKKQKTDQATNKNDEGEGCPVTTKKQKTNQATNKNDEGEGCPVTTKKQKTDQAPKGNELKKQKTNQAPNEDAPKPPVDNQAPKGNTPKQPVDNQAPNEDALKQPQSGSQ